MLSLERVVRRCPAYFPVRVDEGEEPTFSCATCGWTPGCTGTPAPLIWAVIRHWLVEHWDRCGPPRE